MTQPANDTTHPDHPGRPEPLRPARRPDGHLVGRRRALAHRARHQPVRLAGAGRARPHERRAAQRRRSTCSSSTASATSSPRAATPSGCATPGPPARGELHLGKRSEAVELVELPADQRVPVLRVYLTSWGWEVGRFVEGLSKKSTDAEIAAVAPGMPVFLVRTAA